MLCGKLTIGRQEQQWETSQGVTVVAQARNNYDLDKGGGNSNSGGFSTCIGGRSNTVLLADELDINYEGRRKFEDTPWRRYILDNLLKLERTGGGTGSGIEIKGPVRGILS